MPLQKILSKLSLFENSEYLDLKDYKPRKYLAFGYKVITNEVRSNEDWFLNKIYFKFDKKSDL